MSGIESLVLSYTAPDIGVPYSLESNTVSVDVDSHEQLHGVQRNVAELNPNALIISRTSSTCVITSVLHSLLIQIGEVAKLGFLLVSIKSDDRCIKVDRTAASPSQANDYSITARW